MPSRPLIAIDATMAPPRPTGGSYYVLNLVRALAAVDSEFDFVVFARSHTLPQLRGLSGSVALVDVGSLPRWRRYVWEQTGLPLQLRRRHAALLHSPHYTTPLFYCPCPRVITVHDLTFFLYPRRFTFARRLLFQAAILLGSRRARRIIVPSRSTADDLRTLARAPESRLHITYEGVDPAFHPLDREASEALVSQRYKLPRGYLLSLGTREPGKNRGLIYRAMQRLVSLGHDPRLAVVGGGGWGSDDDAEVRALGLEQRVTFTGYVPQEDLPAVYNGAAAFLFPSLHEGFGLAALEAMACGTPVIASSSGSLPEVVGDAGLLVDPGDDAALAEAILRLHEGPALREQLSRAGIERAASFTWQACALKTLDAYRRALAAAP